MTSPTNYLRRFFEEKQIENMEYQLEDKNGVTHFLNTEVVIEHIMITSDSEKKKIAEILRKIDYKNGSIAHFLKFLAIGLVSNDNR